MDIDTERDHQRRRYQLCRLGFAFISGALIVACVTTFLGLLELTRPFGGGGLAPRVRESVFWRWSDAPVLWGSLIGAYLLWGRWTDPSWQRRAGLLLLMSMVDLVLWFLQHGNALGLLQGDFGHEWLRDQLGRALGWAEFALLASLAGDLMFHLGVDQAPDASKATRALARTGAVVWMLLFLIRTDWNGGWPLANQKIPSLEIFFILVGMEMIWTITLVQVTALAIAATRQTSRVLREMAVEDMSHDLLKSPSDAHFGLTPTQRDEHSDDRW